MRSGVGMKASCPRKQQHSLIVRSTDVALQRVLPRRSPVICFSQKSEQPSFAGQLGVRAAAALLASSLVLGGVAQAVTTQQLLFLEAWRAVDRAYVDKSFNGQTWFRMREQYLKQEDMDNKGQTYAAIRKLLATLDDPFTRFLEPDRLAALRRGTSGSVTGVGVEVTYDDKAKSATEAELVVVTPLPGGPADQAGVRAGDIITAIDGTPTRGLSLYEASDLLLGEQGSSVTLTVRPSRGGSAKDVTLTRQKLSVNAVQATTCTGVAPGVGPGSSLGYIRVATFNSTTPQAFRDALADIKAQGVAGIVLDIRNNGGGSFPAGVQVARSLIGAGDVVLIADSDGVRDIVSADGTAIDATTPLSVLVNKGTASASEVLAGALRDSRASATTIAGEPTYGKGLIQTIVNLSDGSGVAVTVSRYQTPAGTDINKVGIAPDIRLDPSALPPGPPQAVCSALQGPDAPKLFR